MTISEISTRPGASILGQVTASQPIRSLLACTWIRAQFSALRWDSSTFLFANDHSTVGDNYCTSCSHGNPVTDDVMSEVSLNNSNYKVHNMYTCVWKAIIYERSVSRYKLRQMSFLTNISRDSAISLCLTFSVCHCGKSSLVTKRTSKSMLSRCWQNEKLQNTLK